MKIDIQRSEERGRANYDWLDTRYSFSFANYYNPDRLGFGLLRVLNEDFIGAGRGFDEHPHDNMEIVTIVLEGALEHKDSMGNQGVIPAGDVQRMSAGTGVTHSEYNHSQSEQVHVLQIWVQPREKNITPSYEQKSFSAEKNTLLPVVSGSDKEGALSINQDAEFLLGSVDKAVAYTLTNPDHGVYVFVIRGRVSIGETQLKKGDAAGISETEQIKITASVPSKILLIEIPLKQ